MFNPSNEAFRMFNNAVANRDVPSHYYQGGMFNGLVKAFSNCEATHAAIALTDKGWGVYQVGRGDERPMFGIYADTADEAIEFAQSLV